MFYRNELIQYRHVKFRSNGLQIFTKVQTSLKTKYNQILQHLASENCSIHGLHTVVKSHERRWLRFFWTIVVLMAIAGCATMYSILAKRHERQLLKTVVETSQLPIYNIDFPSVAICTWNHVNWLRVSAAEDRFLPPKSDTRTRSAFRELLISMEALDFGQFDQFSSIELRRNDLKVIDDSISITELAQFMAFRCEEIFVADSCVFDETHHECCKLFVLERTERGYCLVFNSMISEEAKKKKLTDTHYPWKINRAGEGSGLLFSLRYNETYQRPGNTIPFALNLMIKEPHVWTYPRSLIIYPNTHNYVTMQPHMTVTSNNTRRMKPNKRLCLFEDEKSKTYLSPHGLPYNLWNCRTHCKQEFLINVCNCTIPLFFPDTVPKQPECKASDYFCIYQNRDIFSYVKLPRQDEYIEDVRRGMFCDCINSCESIIYLLTYNANLLKKPNQSYPIINFDIYFGRTTMTRYATMLEYTFMDLIANFGGVMGLFLGASVLSFAEVAYFIIKMLLLTFRERQQVRQELKNIKCKHLRRNRPTKNLKKSLHI